MIQQGSEGDVFLRFNQSPNSSSLLQTVPVVGQRVVVVPYRIGHCWSPL